MKLEWQTGTPLPAVGVHLPDNRIEPSAAFIFYDNNIYEGAQKKYDYLQK